MTVPEMKRLIGCFAILSCLVGFAMVRSAFGTVFAPLPAAFLALGAAAVWAAMHYTLGKHPEGYRGLGDIFVFIFFGLATVCGGYFLTCLAWDRSILLPASAIGCFSVAVLNVNNIRDMKSDAETRTTVALKLGLRRARIYQTVLIAAGWVLMTVYAVQNAQGWLSFMYVVSLAGFLTHLRGVWTREDRALDPMLPMLVMSTFLFALLAGITL